MFAGVILLVMLAYELRARNVLSMMWHATGTELEDVMCGHDGCQTDGPEKHECFPILVPHNDPVFGGHKRCLMFVRSLAVPNENCEPGPSLSLFSRI